MAAQAGEAFVIRTYPYQEASVIVSFFTRDQGKLRGIARAARRPKNSFGSSLERLSQVRIYYSQRENRELVNIASCDLLQSQFGLLGDYAAVVALDYVAELCEHLLPPNEPNDKFYRLIATVLENMRAQGPGGVWPAVTYFSLWAVRLSGFLPELRLSAESRDIAIEMMQRPIADLTERAWTPRTCADMRRVLIRSIQDHIEQRLITPPMLEAL